MTRWVEEDFERWFLSTPILPGDEQLVVVSQQRPIRRVVDLLCLDEEGGLVLIEVKNERSTRTVIGQAFEYLSDLEVVDLDLLLDDLDASREEKVRSRLDLLDWKVSDITRRRRVILAAPRFDYPTRAAAVFLRERFAAADLEVHLLEVTPTAEGFDLSYVDLERPCWVRDLQGRCGITPGRRLFYALPDVDQPLVLNLGVLRDETLRRPRGHSATQRLMRTYTCRLIPYDGKFRPRAGEFGAVWKHVRSHRRVIILARVALEQEPGKEWVFALEEAGEFARFGVREAQGLERYYVSDPNRNRAWPPEWVTEVT